MSGRVTRLVDVLMGVADLTGVDYTRQLSVSQRGAMIRLVKEHAAAVWEEYPWPETVRVESRYFAAEFSYATTYATGALVRVTDAEGVATYYESLLAFAARVAIGTALEVDVPTKSFFLSSVSGVPTGLDIEDATLLEMDGTDYEIASIVAFGGGYFFFLTTAPAFSNGESILLKIGPEDISGAWEESSSYVHELDLAATGETEMYRVFAVYSEDPDVVANPAEERFELMGGVIRLDPDAVGRVWVEFQIVPPALNASVWTASQAVVVGDVRYYETGNYGDCYEVLTAHNSEVPVGSAKWRKVEMPASIASAVKYLASADLLRADGKEDTARAREGKAQEALERAMSSFNNHQHQSARWRARVAA